MSIRPWLVAPVALALACAPDRQLPPEPGAGADNPGAAGAAAASGLPCDVAQVLQKDCLSCHSATPKYGAPMSLATYEDLQKPAPSDATKTSAELSLVRMQDHARPMPPGAVPADADVNAIASWLQAGAPRGSCGGGGTTTDTTPPPASDTPPATTPSGLPCDVAKVLADRCISCHSSPPQAGAPMALVTWEDLAKASPSDPSKTNAVLSLERMQDASRPMPPGGGLSAAELATISNWVSAGAASGTCDNIANTGTTTPPANPLPDNGNVCTSQSYWKSGNSGSSHMNPGLACLACHNERGEGPQTVGGTVFPSLHEPDLCNGQGGVTVEVTDAKGKVVSLSANSSGNFYSSDSLSYPIRARVISGSKVREMLTAQPSADCNSCHTQAGTSGAPGRVVAP